MPQPRLSFACPFLYKGEAIGTFAIVALVVLVLLRIGMILFLLYFPIARVTGGERSEIHGLRMQSPSCGWQICDGFRCAQPILHVLTDLPHSDALIPAARVTPSSPPTPPASAVPRQHA